jgi:hypothetical protein
LNVIRRVVHRADSIGETAAWQAIAGAILK